MRTWESLPRTEEQSPLYPELHVDLLLQLCDLRYGVVHTGVLRGLLDHTHSGEMKTDTFVAVRAVTGRVTSSAELLAGSWAFGAALDAELQLSSFTLKRSRYQDSRFHQSSRDLDRNLNANLSA